MSLGDLSRINTNVQSMRALSQLNKTNSELGLRQMRLATGSRLNRAEDDSAGYSIAKKLEAKIRGQNQALANIGDAKGMLTVAEGSLNSVMDILQTMKEKAVQAANDTLGAEERKAIQGQLNAMTAEIKDIIAGTEFNGVKLFDSENDVALSFQVGATAQDQDKFDVTIGRLDVDSTDAAAGGLFSSADLTADVFNGEWTIEDGDNARVALGAIDHAIQNIANRLANIGDDQTRLSFKQDNLQTSINNYEASKSRITDADFAKEQMEIVKLQILQQTGIASLAQANAGPQAVLSLIG